jgi:hypothetical protein
MTASLRPEVTRAGRERSGLFVTHTNANTERTLRRARTIVHERVAGGALVSDVKTIRSRHCCDNR